MYVYVCCWRGMCQPGGVRQKAGERGRSRVQQCSRVERQQQRGEGDSQRHPLLEQTGQRIESKEQGREEEREERMKKDGEREEKSRQREREREREREEDGGTERLHWGDRQLAVRLYKTVQITNQLTNLVIENIAGILDYWITGRCLF